MPRMWILLAALLLHHATAAEYDVSKTVTVKGTVTHVEWSNPHIHVFIEVKPQGGGTQTWDVEFPAPGAAIVAGVSKELLTPKAVLTIEGFPGKPDFHPKSVKPANSFACAKSATFADGSRVVFTVGT